MARALTASLPRQENEVAREVYQKSVREIPVVAKLTTNGAWMKHEPLKEWPKNAEKLPRSNENRA